MMRRRRRSRFFNHFLREYCVFTIMISAMVLPPLPPAQIARPPVVARKFWELQQSFPGPGRYRGRWMVVTIERPAVTIWGGGWWEMLWRPCACVWSQDQPQRQQRLKVANCLQLTTTRPACGPFSLGKGIHRTPCLSPCC